MDLRPLTDEELLRRLEALASSEREVLGDVIEHLVEADRRDKIFDHGYSSLYDYCRRRLRYPEFGALARIRAARACRDHPEVLPKLRSGELHLEAVMRLYPYLSASNAPALLEKAAGATLREVKTLVADLKGPEPSKPDRIMPLAKGPASDAPLFSADARLPVSDGSVEVIPPPRRVLVEFEADEALLAKIDRLKSLLRNKYPFARFEEIFSDAADALLDRVDPDRKGPSARTLTNCGQPQLHSAARKRNRWIPAAVKRAVWRRDGGRCAYVSDDGRRCESVDALQYDHIKPYALGGASDDPGNIRLLCRPHNQRLARKRFGPRRRKPEAAGG